MTRKLEIETFWENYIVPDISLRETATIYDLTTHAQLIGKHISPATLIHLPLLKVIVESVSWLVGSGLHYDLQRFRAQEVLLLS